MVFCSKNSIVVIYLLLSAILCCPALSFAQEADTSAVQTDTISSIPVNDTLPPNDTLVVKSDSSLVKPTIAIDRSKKQLSCAFLNRDLVINQSQAISNVLFIINLDEKPYEFYMEVSSPAGWRTLTSNTKTYQLAPGDSIFVPVRLVPNITTMKGGARYSINLFLVEVEGKGLSMASFFVSRPRKVNWEMKVQPQSRVYFLNDEYTVPVDIYLANNGEDAQDVNLSWKVLGRGLTLRQDSTRKNKNYVDFSLRSEEDTTFKFNADISTPDRNFRRIDTESYRPVSAFDARKYSIYFKAIEPLSVKTGSKDSTLPEKAQRVRLNSSVELVKLSDKFTANQFGSAVIPVTWYGNVFNVLGAQPIATNLLRANLNLPNNTFLYANLQHAFSFYSPSQRTVRNLQGNLAYFSPKLDAMIGQAAFLREPMIQGVGGVVNTGAGVRADYRVLPYLSIGAFYSQGPRLITVEPQSQNFGISTGYKSLDKKFQAGIGYTRSEFSAQSSTMNNIAGGARYKLNKDHVFGARYAQIIRTNNIGMPTQTLTTANNWMATYNGRFLDQRLVQNVSFLNRKNLFIGQENFGRTLYGRSQTFWRGDKVGLGLGTGYVQTESFYSGRSHNLIQIPTTLSINFVRARKIIVLPSIYYNYSQDDLGRLHQRGLNFNASYFNYEKNLRAGAGIFGGYNKYIDSIASYPETFNANVFLMGAYRSLSANVRYVYGHMILNSIRAFHHNPTRYPQYIFTNINKQHTFKNTHFVGELALNHSWNNITYSHNLSLTPQLFFFTNSGWRFNAMVFYNFNARNTEKAIEFYQFQGTAGRIPEPDERMQYNTNFNLSFGVRKEFGIPVPKRFRKVFFTDATFVVFLDFNGNGIMDSDEVPLENVVIRLNGNEVLTNKDGTGTFTNLQQEKYEYKITPLTDMGGWFTKSMDSLEITTSRQYYVPFTRGVKIIGNIIMDREKFSADIRADLDLSQIRIFAMDSLGNTYSTLTDVNGEYSFYVPFGTYRLNLDENILSDRFMLGQNNIPLELEEGMDSFYQSFFIIEKKRTVRKKRFNGNGEQIEGE